MSQDGLLLGVDIGTQSSKGVLVATDGRVVEQVQRPHGMAHPRPGHFEQDAEEVWWGDFVHLCRELLARDGVDPRAVAAVGVSGIGPCVVPADAAGTPLRPGILYGIDTRAVGEAAWLTDHYGEDAVLAMGRSPLTSQAVGPKLLWLRRHEPDVSAATERFFMASSYVVFRLTGEYTLDHHSASGVNPFYDASRHGTLRGSATSSAGWRCRRCVGRRSRPAPCTPQQPSRPAWPRAPR
ncbi:MAG TPA: FGGY family carbohydrate kinase [Egibacteraceae bacterium]|nr:FGGY family carbohydrate kinase [Egibacteraceae bacterium]